MCYANCVNWHEWIDRTIDYLLNESKIPNIINNRSIKSNVSGLTVDGSNVVTRTEIVQNTLISGNTNVRTNEPTHNIDNVNNVDVEPVNDQTNLFDDLLSNDDNDNISEFEDGIITVKDTKDGFSNSWDVESVTNCVETAKPSSEPDRHLVNDYLTGKDTTAINVTQPGNTLMMNQLEMINVYTNTVPNGIKETDKVNVTIVVYE